jgi:hypothetical protein
MNRAMDGPFVWETREEWLLDDAIDDTFPASDPVSPGQPGSIVNLRYAALEGARRRRRSIDRHLIAWSVLVGAAVACTVALVLRRPRFTERLR